MKTRLCPPLDPVASAELYHRLLHDLFRRFGRQKNHFHFGVAYSPTEGREFFERITPAGAHLFLQEGADLAERIVHFFQKAFSEGFGPVVILGSDVPFLSVDRVTDAFEALASQADLAVGPDGGGGYYLLGLRSPVPELFQDVEMSTQGMLEETLEKAQTLRLRHVLLPVEHDLDYPEDLLRLVEAVARKPKLREEIPELFSFLRELGYLTELSQRL